MTDRDRTRSKSGSPASRKSAPKADEPARSKPRAATPAAPRSSAEPVPASVPKGGVAQPKGVRPRTRSASAASGDEGPATARSRLPSPPPAAPLEAAPSASEPPATDTAPIPRASSEPSEPAPPSARAQPAGAPASDRPIDSGVLVPGFDLEGEATFDIAPVAATEPALRHRASTAPPSSPPPSVSAPPHDGAAEADPAELEEQIRELEARLDRMIRQRANLVPAPSPSQPGGESSAKSTQPPAGPSPLARDTAASWGSARDLLSTDYYLRQWGKLGMRNRSEEVDDLGLDPVYEARIRPLVDFLYRHYFRVDVEGVEAIPEEGRCLIVANHSGGPLPYDGLMIRAAVRREHVKQRDVRWLTEDFVFHLPFVGATLNRIGAVRACPENAERLLDREQAVAVFPEGAQGLGKLFRERYKLQRFGRGGFVRLCLRTRTPIIPCAIIGAEEANPVLYRIEHMTKALGIPYFPITPTFPALGPLGLLPAPTKWMIRFGEPMSFDEHGPGTADDEGLVGRLSEKVRAAIQGMVDRTVRERRSVWFG